MKISISLIASLALFAELSMAGPGDLDPTFGTGGKAVVNIGGMNSIALAVAAHNDKILVAGIVVTSGGVDLVVAKLDSSGSLDPTFGTSGFSVVPIEPGNSGPTSMAVQADGKIVVVGYAVVGDKRKIAVVRLNESGSLDSAFGDGGKVTTSLGANDDVANSVLIQSDGKILVGGWSKQPASSDFAVVRYHSNGSLDASFGVNGVVLTNFNGISQDRGECLGLYSDGTFVLGGSYNDHVSGSWLAMAKYTSAGALDASFGSGGKVTTFVPSTPGYTNGSVETLAIQSDGKIVTGGHFGNGSKGSFVIGRYLSSGAIDSTFGNEGIVITNVTTGHDYAEGLKVQSDGKILVAGYSLPPSGLRDFVLARYSASGSLDQTFGTAGKVVTDFGGNDEVYAMLLQSDGKAVLAGFSESLPHNNMALARYGVGSSSLTNLQAWRLLWFGTIDDIGTAANLYDADNDGAVNLLEFATYQSPTMPTPQPTWVTLNGNDLDFTYPRSKGAIADGFSFVVEWSDSLNGLDWSVAGVSQVIVDEDSNRQDMKAALPSGNIGRRFVRLKVTGP